MPLLHDQGRRPARRRRRPAEPGPRRRALAGELRRRRGHRRRRRGRPQPRRAGGQASRCAGRPGHRGGRRPGLGHPGRRRRRRRPRGRRRPPRRRPPVGRAGPGRRLLGRRGHRPGRRPPPLQPPRPGAGATTPRASSFRRRSRPGTLVAVPATASTAPGYTRPGRPHAENTRPRLDRCSAHRVRPDRPHRPRSRPVFGPPLRQLASDPFHPVEGGSCNDYDYVCGDPIGLFDTTGTHKVPCHIEAKAPERIAQQVYASGTVNCGLPIDVIGIDIKLQVRIAKGFWITLASSSTSELDEASISWALQSNGLRGNYEYRTVVTLHASLGGHQLSGQRTRRGPYRRIELSQGYEIR